MSNQQADSAQVDMRGFQYALTPFVKKQEWHMESLQRQLSKAQVAWAQAQEELKTMQIGLEVHSAQVQQALDKRPDPFTHQRGLEFLVTLRNHIQKQHRTLDSLRVEKARIQSECLVQQRKLDGLAEHRNQAQSDFASEQARHVAAEADRDWIGRMRHNTRDVRRNEDVL